MLAILLPAATRTAEAGPVDVVVGLRGTATKRLLVAPECRQRAATTLKKSQLSGSYVPVLESKSVSTGSGSTAEMLVIELDGARFCVARADVLLSGDAGAARPAPPTRKSPIGPSQLTGATRGLGEGQE